jgi:hypothetical protein
MTPIYIRLKLNRYNSTLKFEYDNPREYARYDNCIYPLSKMCADGGWPYWERYAPVSNEWSTDTVAAKYISTITATNDISLSYFLNKRLNNRVNQDNV